MKITHVESNVVHKETRVDAVVCDICGARTNICPFMAGEGGWGDRYCYEIVHVECSQYRPDLNGGYADQEVFDICADCFHNKIVPFINQAHANQDRKQTH